MHNGLSKIDRSLIHLEVNKGDEDIMLRLASAFFQRKLVRKWSSTKVTLTNKKEKSS